MLQPSQQSNSLDLSLLNKPAARRALADQSFGWFCGLYLSHYFTLEGPEFQPEMLALMESWDVPMLSIIGFRGCGKSALMTLGLPLWAALTGRSHFLVLFSDTTVQSGMNIANLRHELESNSLLIEDYGDMSFKVSKNREWTKSALLFSNGAKVMGRSRGQRIRGLRHRQYRPDLVVVDDPEELKKVQKKEYRDATETWFRGDLIPSINEFKSRLIVGGNILHTDALMARLRNDPSFVHRDWPLIREDDTCTWPGKYGNPDDLMRQEMKVGAVAWLREYKLKVVPPEGAVVKPEWIAKYAKLPPAEHITQLAVGVDLAISKKDTADYTAMVSVVCTFQEGRPRIYVLPNPVMERLSLHETIGRMSALTQVLSVYGMATFHVEDVGYQRAAIEEAQAKMLAVNPVHPVGDKRARLGTIATFIQNGTIVFPESGCEDLLAQVLGFGVEDHDDLCDAFVYAVQGAIQAGIELQGVQVL